MVPILANEMEKKQISHYLLDGPGAAVGIIGGWVVSVTKMYKQTTEC